MYSNPQQEFAAFDFPLETYSASPFDDQDFLSLLNKHTKPATTPFIGGGGSQTQLTSVNPSPPTSGTDSSPSSPNLESHSNQPADLNSASLISNYAQMSTRTTRSANRDSLDGLGKRKAPIDVDDPEDDDDLPPSKLQHTDGASKKTKRKSVGGGQDEFRLQKRKEQNRAAQRAFRERKEKHVKDLEDKVAMLEAKTDTQAAENENLRELLTRLQSENMQLKQSQFNFTFPINANFGADPSTASSSEPSSSTARQNAPDQQMSLINNSTPSTNNNAVASSSSGNPTPPSHSGSTPELNMFDSFSMSSGDPYISMGLTPPSAGSNNNTGGSGHPYIDLVNGNYGSFAGAMPYQTLASNPLFSSYREPTPSAWASFGANAGTSSSSGEVTLNSYDELFGGAGVSGALGTGSDWMKGLSSLDELLTFNYLPDPSSNGAPAQTGGGSNAISPVSHHNISPTPATSTSANSANSMNGLLSPSTGSQSNFVNQPSPTGLSPLSSSSPQSQHSQHSQHSQQGQHSEETCPKSKQDFEALIGQQPPNTFGPPVSTTTTTTSSNSSGLQGKAEGCSILPADPTKVNLDLGTAWKAVRQHPQFEECDIDALCAELSEKARCDAGTKTKVVEAQNIMDLVHSIPSRAQMRKAQTKMNL